MFGFKALAVGARLLTRTSAQSFTSFKPQHLAWSHLETSHALLRANPIPGSGLTLLNLREILQKCKNESDVEPELLVNGNILSEHLNVLSRVSSINMTLALTQIGMARNPRTCAPLA